METQTVISTVAETIANTDDLQVIYDPQVESEREGRFEPLSSSSLHPAVIEMLEQEFPHGLYHHQHQAIEQVLQGENTVVATRTSSGKSLIYSLPTFDALCHDFDSTALFLFPQKALANDQLLKLNSMADEIGPISELRAENPHLISRYDGSVPGEQRKPIRNNVQVMLTNPDMLHHGIMQYHEQNWARFFSRLKIVVIDECHDYRGVFGTNVAYILHRLKQICQHYGANPKFIATSATVRDPQEHMEYLTGTEFSCIGPEQDGSQQGSRKFWMVDSENHYYETGRKLALKLADAGLTVLAFCPSRVSAERMVSRLPKSATEENSYVRVYRSGLSSGEREKIEQGLRTGDVRLVFSTSALELGIDIGSIDVVVCIGLPNSMMSLWQRAGRAARGGKEGATIFIPAEKPIDSYYANHPDELFKRDHEPLVLNLSNKRIACQHYACAVQEVGGDEERLQEEPLGEQLAQIKQLRAEGKLNRDEFYRSEPHGEINIRNSGEGAYSLMVNDETIGEIDSIHLLRECSRNAIYRHGGRSYRVKDVLRGKRIVRLQPFFSKNETTPYIQKKIRLKQQINKSDYSNLRIAQVTLDVTEFLMNITERDPSGANIRTWQGSQGMPSNHLPTEGTMILFQHSFWDMVKEQISDSKQVALGACERLFCSLFPTVSGPCDTQDFSSGIDKLTTGEYAIFIYDLVYDGVDLTNVAYEMMEQLVERSLERIKNCQCSNDEGCIRCVVDSHSSQNVSKSAAKEVLCAILKVLQSEQPVVTQSPSEWSHDLSDETTLNCATCQSEVAAGSKFCPNCGSKLELE